MTGLLNFYFLKIGLQTIDECPYRQRGVEQQFHISTFYERENENEQVRKGQQTRWNSSYGQCGCWELNLGSLHQRPVL